MRDRLEKRLAPRRTAAIAAHVLYGTAKDPCIIRNVSDTGAKIEVKYVNRVPNTFHLLIEGYEPQPCRVVWRSLREMGIQFLNADFGRSI